VTWNPLAAIFDIQRTVHAIQTKVATMSDQQDEINADVAELQAADANILAEIANLQAANPALDLTALKAAVDATGAIAPPAAP
jgi:peptidoglycan hydrolase CwlO-like protein